MGQPTTNRAILFEEHGCSSVQSIVDRNSDPVFTDPGGRVFLIGPELRDAHTGRVISANQCDAPGGAAIASSSSVMAIACGRELNLVDIRNGETQRIDAFRDLDDVVVSSNGRYFLARSHGALHLFDRDGRFMRTANIGFALARLTGVSDDGETGYVMIGSSTGLSISLRTLFAPSRQTNLGISITRGDAEDETNRIVLDTPGNVAVVWDTRGWREVRRMTALNGPTRSRFDAGYVRSIGPRWAISWDADTGAVASRIPTSSLDGEFEGDPGPPERARLIGLLSHPESPVAFAAGARDRPFVIAYEDGYLAEYDAERALAAYNDLRTWACATLLAPGGPEIRPIYAVTAYLEGLSSSSVRRTDGQHCK
ncbi:MAG: hypothetical protein NT015_12500 [Alphaproteobacteria bacterium]|nr:hypothetical protein [Alphaproteobacteria bacterium]